MSPTINITKKWPSFASWKAIAVSVTMAFSAYTANAQDYIKIIEKSHGRDFKEVVAEIEALYKGKSKGTGTGYKQFQRWVDFNKGRLTKDGKVQNLSQALLDASDKYDKYLRKAHKNSRLAAATPTWSLIGANSNVRLAPGYTNGNGRVDRLAVDPSNNSIIYAGSPAGGLWRTTTGGTSWSCLTNGIPNLVSVSGIAIDHSTTVTNRTLYYLSGNDGGFAGIYKSTNNGTSWTPSGLTDKGISSGRELVIHPTNAQTLFAVTNAGIFRTTTGGSSWSLVKSGNFYDLKFKPGTPNTIYASTNSQVFISSDGGSNWTQLTNGLPTSSFRRIVLAVTPAQPSYLYVLDGEQLTTPGLYAGLYRSTDSGASFSLRSTSPNILDGSDNGDDDGNIADYAMAIAVSPTDANEIHVGGLNCWKSIDGGVTWARTSKWGADFAGLGNYTHADIHHLHYVGSTLFCGSDGGVYKSTNKAEDWSEINTGLQISQIYRLAPDQNHLDRTFCGLQDNGVNYISNQILYHWFGADGMEVFASPTNTNVMYGSVQFGGLLKSTDNGASTVGISPPGAESGNWTTPFLVDPKNPTTLYAGYTEVFKSTDEGGSWTNISNGQLGGGSCDRLAVSAANTQVIYASKASYYLYRSVNGGGTWTEQSNWNVSGSIRDIQAHPTNSNILFVVGSNGVFKVTFGTSAVWEPIANASLPSVPYNSLALDKRSSTNAMYLGTDLGVFYKDDEVTSWVPYSDGLPKVVVTDVDIHYATNTIQIGTYGRGAWKSPLYNTSGITATLTAPALHSEVAQGSNITLTATATAATGTISKVEFFLNDTKIQEVSTAPYTYTLTNVAAGDYVIYAKAYGSLGKVSSSNQAHVRVWKYRSPNNPTNTLAGVDYKYYEGAWDVVPNFAALTPVKTGTVATFSIAPRDRDEEFGFQYKGFVEVPTDGVYTFYTTSDDGSKLFVGDTILVNNDGLHGISTGAASIALRAGKHAITAEYFERGGANETFIVSYSGPSIAKQEIPQTVLYRTTTLTNQAPTAQITAPLNNASFTAPASITIEASAFDAENGLVRVDFYNGTQLLGSDFSYPYSYVWTSVPSGNYQLKAVAIDNASLSGTSAIVSVSVSNASTCILDEPIPAATNYVVRNDWGDHVSGATVTNESSALKVAHRAWGKNELWVIETGKSISVVNGQSYQISLDFKDFAGYAINGVDVGFSYGLNSGGNGPALAQPVVAFAAGYSSASYTTKSANITSSVTGSVKLVIRLRWTSQPSVAVTNYLKNITVCANSPAPIVTGIDEINDVDMSIMPNPSAQNFTMSAQKGIQVLVVTNTTGQVLFSANHVSGGAQLEFGSNFHPGVYNVAVQYSDGRTKTYRLLKQ